MLLVNLAKPAFWLFKCSQFQFEAAPCFVEFFFSKEKNLKTKANPLVARQFCGLEPPKTAAPASSFLKENPPQRRSKTPRVTEQDLISRLRQQDKAAQKWLYDHYSGLFFHVCRRYLTRREEAEEALLNGFFKAMTLIEKYEGTGSFEGWVRRIMVNESLMMLRARQPFHFPVEEARLEGRADDFSIEAELSAQRDFGTFGGTAARLPHRFQPLRDRRDEAPRNCRRAPNFDKHLQKPAHPRPPTARRAAQTEPENFP